MSEGLRQFDDRQSESIEVEKRTFTNLIVLGNAVPDEISDNRKTVCTVAFSEECGLIRIYPVPPSKRMRRWNVVSIPLERNSRDSRLESWKIQGSKDEWSTLSDKIDVLRSLSRNEQISLMKRLKKDYSYGCIEELNEKKLSLGIIIPKIVDTTFEERKDSDSSIQSTLGNDDLFITIKNYKIRPKISYNCSKCQKNLHNQGVLEWGVYEFIRKNPQTPEKVWDNLRIREPGYDRCFLVGNLNRHRNVFMIISIFRYKV